MDHSIRSGRGNQQVRTNKGIAMELDKWQRLFMTDGLLPPQNKRFDRIMRIMRMPNGNTDFMEVQYAYAARKFDNHAIAIAKWLLINDAAVYFAFDKLGIEWDESKPPFTEKQLRKAIQKDGMSARTASKHFKCAIATIMRFKRRWDIYNKGILNRREMFLLIEQWWYGNGVKPAVIRRRLVKHFSVSIDRINRDIRKMKRAGIIPQKF